jgi:hypothetical protein
MYFDWLGRLRRARRLVPPEHFLAHRLGEALAASCRAGRLIRQGPDGKLLVRLRESTVAGSWQILVTLQQREEVSLLDVTAWVVDDCAISMRLCADATRGRRRLQRY